MSSEFLSPKRFGYLDTRRPRETRSCSRIVVRICCCTRLGLFSWTKLPKSLDLEDQVLRKRETAPFLPISSKFSMLTLQRVFCATHIKCTIRLSDRMFSYLWISSQQEQKPLKWMLHLSFRYNLTDSYSVSGRSCCRRTSCFQMRKRMNLDQIGVFRADSYWRMEYPDWNQRFSWTARILNQSHFEGDTDVATECLFLNLKTFFPKETWKVKEWRPFFQFFEKCERTVGLFYQIMSRAESRTSNLCQVVVHRLGSDIGQPRIEALGPKVCT